jgi:hypothetical protein
MNRTDLPRDKHDVLKPLNMPKHSTERWIGQDGDWVLFALIRSTQGIEAVPVLDYTDRTFMQRYMHERDVLHMAYHVSAVRVGGGMAVNIKTGETVRIPAGQPVNLKQRP